MYVNFKGSIRLRVKKGNHINDDGNDNISASERVRNAHTCIFIWMSLLKHAILVPI